MATKHRGKHSNDDKFFSPQWHSVIAEAAYDVSWLLGKNYGFNSAISFVGTKYKLNARQQRALSLIVCPSHKISERKNKSVSAQDLSGKNIVIDGFNLLISIEAALSHAYLLIGQDGCCRDIASIHGSYKKVQETMPAIALIDETLKSLKVQHALWFFDLPVSNSGMLKTLLYEYAVKNNVPWDVSLTLNPDRKLIIEKNIVISCDSWVIDNCESYFDLAGFIVRTLPVEPLNFSTSLDSQFKHHC